MIIIGYSGHAYVVIETLLTSEQKVEYYCDKEEKSKNPYSLKYLGNEDSENAIHLLKETKYFVAIGDNQLRANITNKLISLTQSQPINAISKFANLSSNIKLDSGILIVSGATVNAFSQLGKGVIINTNASVDHECVIDNFAHIAPGAVLCGNVTIGESSFVGANAVIKQGVTIGKNVIIGAGAVVVNDIEDNVIVVGNPAKKISK